MLIGGYEKDDGVVVCGVVKKNYSRYLLALAFATKKKKIGQMYLTLQHTIPSSGACTVFKGSSSQNDNNNNNTLVLHVRLGSVKVALSIDTKNIVEL